MKKVWNISGPDTDDLLIEGDDEDAAAEDYARQEAARIYGPDLGFACAIEHLHDEYHYHSALIGRAPACDEYGAVLRAGTARRRWFFSQLKEDEGGKNDEQE